MTISLVTGGAGFVGRLLVIDIALNLIYKKINRKIVLNLKLNTNF